MKYIKFLLFIFLTVSCFESEEDEPGDVYSGHKAGVNLLTLVNPANPTYYKNGDTFYVVLEFPGETVVTGVPNISIDIGGSSQTATFFDQGINSSELWFEYTVTGTDIDSDGIEVVPSVNLNGGSIKYQTTFDVNTVFTDTSVSNLVVDGIGPNLTATNVPPDGTYEFNETLTLSLDYDEPVYTYGTPQVSFDLAGSTENFVYTSGSGTSTLNFSYQVKDPDLDIDGIVISTVIDFNGGEGIKDFSGNVTSTTIVPGATPGIIIDGDSPKILSITQPGNKTYGIGESLDFVLTFSEDVDVTVGGPRIAINAGGATLYADYSTGTSSNSLTFRYTVGIGDTDTDGITLTSPFELNGSTIKDSGGRDALLTFTIPNTSFVNIDGVVPTAPSFSSWEPDSPSDINSPRLNLMTEAYATVTIYSDSGCSSLVDSGAASSGGEIYFDLSALAAGSTSYWATATDLAGNDSTCSVSSYDFEVYEIPDGMALFQGTTTTFGSNLNQVGSYYSMIWDTLLRYDSSYFSHSPNASPERITVLQSGDYKLSFNLPLDLASTAQRAAIQAIVTVNGVIQDEAVSESTYIRNFSAHDETSTSMTILLDDLNINDYIEVKLKGSTLVGAVNTYERASVHLDYIGTDSIFYAKATEVTGGTNLNGTEDSLEWLEVEKSSSFTHSDSSNPENITIAENGSYLVYVNLPLSSSIARSSARIRIRVNGVSVNGGIGSQGYIRSDSSHNNSSVHWAGLLENLTALDVITINTEQESAAGTMTVQGGKKGSLLIHKIDTSSNTLSVKGSNVTSGTNWNQVAATPVEWEIQDIFDAAFFNHDPFGLNPESITIQSDGDYLFVFNGSFFSNSERANLKIQVYVNGTAVSGAVSASSYIRALSGHNESSGTFSHYLKDLEVGDIVTVRSQREANGGTVTTLDDARLLMINYPF